jgi:hypothetical protein
MGWYDLSFRDQGTGGNDRSRPDHDSVQKRRSDPDQTFVLDCRSVNDRPVTDGHSVSHRARKSGIGVKAAVILDIALISDPNRFTIPPQHSAEQDAGLLSDVDLS